MMKRVVAATLLAAFVVGLVPGLALAETDGTARRKIRDLEARADVRENKGTTLQLLVQRLETKNRELQQQLNNSFALIEALAQKSGGADQQKNGLPQ